MKFINQHSYLIIAGTIFSILTLLIIRKGISPARLLLILGLAFVFVILFLISNANGSPIERYQSQIGNGKPVLLEFQSRF